MERNAKNNISRKALALLLILAMLLISLVTASVAWFADSLEASNEGFNGSAIVSYFAGGDGSSKNPYLIENSRHLYNLAWLQNTTDFFNEKTYFKLNDDIDMKGQLTLDGESGAIPPIGTKSHPFRGEFDGNGKVISNLWVSTQETDWKRMPKLPDGYQMFDSEINYVGLFGYIEEPAVVFNFILDRVEVKTHVEDSTVGIICGYVDAMVFDVGVYGGTITVAGGVKCKSDYSLLGAKSDSIIWTDMPAIDSTQSTLGGKGGVIRVDINDGYLKDLFTAEKGGSLIDPNNQGYRDIKDAVTEAAAGRAYLTGDVSTDTQQKAPYFFIYSEPISSREGYTSNKKQISTENDKGDITSPSANSFLEIEAAGRNSTTSTYYDVFFGSGNNSLKNKLHYNEDFEKRINALGGSRIILHTGTPPSFDMTSDGWEENFVEIQFDGADKPLYVPKNGVWFKPMAPGASIISFTITNNSNDAYRSIYRYKRFTEGENKGKINPDTVTETVLTFNVSNSLHNKKSNFSNGDIVAFEFVIDKLDVDEGYEFIIGTSSDHPNADDDSGFFFLALAGASNKNGPEFGEDDHPIYDDLMYDVDYVLSTSVDITTEDYKIHQTLLSVNAGGTNAEEAKIYYLARLPEGETTSTVHYCQPSGVTIIDISISDQSTKYDDTDIYEKRQP